MNDFCGFGWGSYTKYCCGYLFKVVQRETLQKFNIEYPGVVSVKTNLRRQHMQSGSFMGLV